MTKYRHTEGWARSERDQQREAGLGDRKTVVPTPVEAGTIPGLKRLGGQLAAVVPQLVGEHQEGLAIPYNVHQARAVERAAHDGDDAVGGDGQDPDPAVGVNGLPFRSELVPESGHA